MLKNKRKFGIWIILFITLLAFTIICYEYKPSIPETVKSDESSKIINVKAISQYPELPTGCETVSTVMALNYYDEKISPIYFAENWLVCADLYTKKDRIYGPDPNVAFIGTPFSKNGFGCYAPVIVRAVNSNSKKCKAENISGKNLDYICKEYINNNLPVILWATMNMKAEKIGRSWYISDSEKFTWIAGEHCLLLIGYDEKFFYFNDPMGGKTVKYKKDITEKRYNTLGKQAVLITKK
ncbi:MAG: C39 family peptidase [Clostridia bacterium]|nr:C39 family peptidase [Clostridia bacterium]